MLWVTRSGPTPLSVIRLHTSKACCHLPLLPHALMRLLYEVRLGGICTAAFTLDYHLRQLVQELQWQLMTIDKLLPINCYTKTPDFSNLQGHKLICTKEHVHTSVGPVSPFFDTPRAYLMRISQNIQTSMVWVSAVVFVFDTIRIYIPSKHSYLGMITLVSIMARGWYSFFHLVISTKYQYQTGNTNKIQGG